MHPIELNLGSSTKPEFRVFRVIPNCKQTSPLITLEDATDNRITIKINQQRRAVDEFVDSYIGLRVYEHLKSTDYGQHGGVIEKQDELSLENSCGPSVLWAFGADLQRLHTPWR